MMHYGYGRHHEQKQYKKVKGWDLDVEVQASFHSSQDTAEKDLEENIVNTIMRECDVVLICPMLQYKT